jgi:hypothetical protein
MLAELRREDYLYQQTVVYDIESEFGEEFTYTNENGNLAIAPQVLKEFRALTGDTVIWVKSERVWRFREDYDEPGRTQN